MSKTTVQVRLYPTTEQSCLLMAHCQQYISTVNVLVAAFDSDVLDFKVSTKDFQSALPSAVKNQALRDAQSVFKRSFEFGCIPILKKPICQWNNQNWRIEQGMLIVPLYLDGKTQQVRIACADLTLPGKAGTLRLKKKRGKWIADIALTLEDPAPTDEQAIMGIDLGVKVPAVAYVRGTGTRFFGNGRYQRMMRRQFYSRRKKLQKAKKRRAVKKSQGKVESLAGIRKGTTRTGGGAKVRKNNRMQNSWSFYQLTLFLMSPVDKT